MVLYTKLVLTLSTAEGNNTAIALFHSTNLLNLTVRALKVWLGQLRHFHYHLQNKVALAERYVPPLVSLHSVVVLSLLETDDIRVRRLITLNMSSP